MNEYLGYASSVWAIAIGVAFFAVHDPRKLTYTVLFSGLVYLLAMYIFKYRAFESRPGNYVVLVFTTPFICGVVQYYLNKIFRAPLQR